MELKYIGDEPKHVIEIEARTLQRFNHILYSKYNLEFTAFTHCDRLENDVYRMYDTFFPNQENTATTTELDSTDLMDLIQDGADITKLNGHMHSHVRMAVFTSGTDVDQILERSVYSGFNASLILNKKGEWYGHIVDRNLGLHIKDVPVRVVYPHSSENFEQEILDAIRSAKSLKDARELLDTTEWEYYELMNPLSDAEKAELDSIISTRFKTPRKSWSKPWKKDVEPARKKVEKIEEVDDWGSWLDYGASDLYPSPFKGRKFESVGLVTEEYREYLDNCPQSTMTNAEWEDYCEFIIGF